MGNLLYDPELREQDTHILAHQISVTMGRVFSIVRLLLAVASLILIWVISGLNWWLLVFLVPVVGTFLNVVHTQEAVLNRLADSRVPLINTIFKSMYKSSGKSGVSIPGALETIGPLLVVLAISVPSGPVTGNTDLLNICLLFTVSYAASSIAQILFDSSLYLSGPKTLPIWAIRFMRASVPMAATLSYSLVLAIFSTEASMISYVCCLIFLLEYPFLVMYEGFLKSAKLIRLPAMKRERVYSAMHVHASVSNPLHFVEIAAPVSTPEEMEMHLAGFRVELASCIRELESGVREIHLSGMIENVKRWISPEARPHLKLAEGSESAEFSRMDAAMARSIISDLCSNALKSRGGGQWPEVTVASEQVGHTISISVTDDGPGLTRDRLGTSMRRLRRILREHGGGLDVAERSPRGTIVKVHWESSYK